MRPLFFLILTGLSHAPSAALQEPDPPATDITITFDDPTKLVENAFAEFAAKIEPGDRAKWSVSPEPLRKKQYGSTFVVDGEKGRTYVISLEVVNFKTEKWVSGSVRYTFGGTAVEPPPKKDGDDKTPPPPTGGPLYFMVVRPDGAADATFTKLMADPGWAALRAKGHLVKDFTRTDAAKWVTAPASPPYVVVTLALSADKKTSTLVRPAVPLPTTTAEIAKLEEGVR